MTRNLADYIDHTQLSAHATRENISQIINEAVEYQFASVCVNPHWVAYCYERLKDTEVKVCTVIGFPLGATSTATKVFEAKQAVLDGATEVDMVINIGELKVENDDFVKQDIAAVVNATKGKAITKVIIETALLTDDEKVRACLLAKEANANFVKTSTGFSTGGATVEDIQLMRQTVGPEMGVKASGGVRDLETMEKMIAAGATRIGASAGVEIINGKKVESNY
jgi:deoxyribose-phosphate aldolase